MLESRRQENRGGRQVFPGDRMLVKDAFEQVAG
jgi:hypothetical protein